MLLPCAVNAIIVFKNVVAKDQKGPVHSPYRQPMHCEDFVEGTNTVKQTKELQVQNKRRKLTDGDVATAQQQISSGHASFNNSMFENVGGAAAHCLAQLGGSIMGARGEGSFTSGSDGSRNVFAEQLEQAKKQTEERKKEKKTPDKDFDSEIMATRIGEKVNDASTKATARIRQLVTAKEEIDIRHSSTSQNLLTGDKAVPGLQRCVDIIAERHALLPFLRTGREGMKPISMNGSVPPLLMAIIKMNDMLAENIKKTALATTVAELLKHCVTDEMLEDKVVTFFLQTNNFSLEAKVFAPPPDLTSMHKMLTTILTWLESSYLLRCFFEQRAAVKKAIPFAVDLIKHLQSCDFFTCLAYMVQRMETADDMKYIELQINMQQELHSKIFNWVKASVDEHNQTLNRFTRKTQMAEQKDQKQRGGGQEGS